MTRQLLCPSSHLLARSQVTAQVGAARSPRSNWSSLSSETELGSAAQGRGFDLRALHADNLGSPDTSCPCG